MRRPFASVLIALGLVLATAVAGSARGGRPVIISTDLATGLQNGWRAGVNDIDDGLAAGMALADGTLDVRGVVVTFGNNDVEPEALVADRLVHALIGHVTMCTAYASAETKRAFLRAIFEFVR